jgi:hypothetical protein
MNVGEISLIIAALYEIEKELPDELSWRGGGEIAAPSPLGSDWTAFPVQTHGARCNRSNAWFRLPNLTAGVAAHSP